MKRVLEVLAMVLLVAGIELATGAGSHALGRLSRVFVHLVSGTDPGVSLPRFFAGAGLTVAGVALLSLDVWARAYSRFVGRGKLCPNCGGPTERVKRQPRHRLLAWVLGEKITRRKCKTCGWSGLSA